MNRITTYFKMALFLWAALYIVFLSILLIETISGHFGRDGGISSFFRTAGLHAHDASIFSLAVTGFGLFLAFAWIVNDVCRAAWRKWAAPVWERWTARHPRFFAPILGVRMPPPELEMYTVHGNAIVTKTGRNTYRIRMLPGAAKR